MSDNEIKVLLTADLAGLQAGMEAATESVTAASEAIAAAVEESSAAVEAAQTAIGESAATAAQAVSASMGEATAATEAAMAQMAESVAAEAVAFNAAVQAKVAAHVRLNAAFAGGVETAAAVAEAEAALDEAMGAGALTATEYAGYVERLNAAELAMAESADVATVAIDANTEAMVINGGVARELGVLTGEALRGNWTRLEGSSITLANRMNLLQYAFSPIGLAAIAAGAAVAGFGYELIKGAEESNQFDKAVMQTGDFLGVTEGQFNRMAQDIQSSETTIGTAREAMMKFAQSGKISGDALENAGKAAVDFAALTGESIDKAVDEILKIQEKPVQALQKLNETYHFLSLAQLEHVQKLQDEGDAVGAAEEAVKLFQETTTDRLAIANKDVGFAIGTWRSLGQAVSAAADAIAGATRGGGNSNADDLAKAQDHLRQAIDGRRELLGLSNDQLVAWAKENQTIGANATSAKEILQAVKDINAATPGAKWEEWTAGTKRQAQSSEDAAIAAAKEDDALLKGMHSVSAYNDALSKELALKKAIHAASPNDERVKGITFDDKGDAVGGEGLDKIKQFLHKKYDVKAEGARHERETLEEELKREEADQQVSNANKQQFELAFWTQKLTVLKAGSAQYAQAYAQVNSLKKQSDAESMRASQRAAQQQQQAAQEEAQISISAAQGALDIKRQQIETAFALGNSSRQHELAALQAANEAEYQEEIKAFAKELTLLDAKSKAAGAVEKQIADLQKRYNLEAQKNTDDQLKAMQQSWKKALKPIDNAFQHSINGMIQGTQTFKKGLENIFSSIVASYAQMGISTVINWIANEGAKTTASAAGAAERTTIEATAATATKASDAATGKSQITSAAATGAAKAYQAMVGIPYVGPFIAPAAAVVAFAGIEAFAGSISSARGGWERVPIDGMMTELHKDEMVLPAHIANPMRQMAMKGGNGGGGGNSYHFHAVDVRSFEDAARRNRAGLMRVIRQAARQGH